MTPRERLLAALSGESTDHVPVWLLFPYHRTSYYVDVRNLPRYRRIHDLAMEKCVTLNRRNPGGIPLFTPDVVETSETRADGSVWTTARCGGVAQTWRRGAKRLVEDEDLEALLSFPIERDPAALRPSLEAFAEKVRAERAEFPLDAGAMMLDIGEPIGFLYHAANLESFSVWSITHNDEIVAWLDRMLERFLDIYRYTLEQDLADVYFLVGSELAAPPMVSPATFERWVVPYAKALIDLVHSYGKKVIQHFHGQIRTILPGFREMGADALHTIEAPPVGNCTFTQAYEALGNGTTLIGNVQYDDFRAMDESEMRQAVRDILAECQGKRLILSPTAGPYDPDPGDRYFANLAAFIDEAWRHGEWRVSTAAESPCSRR